jgi:hypothetical protein
MTHVPRDKRRRTSAKHIVCARVRKVRVRLGGRQGCGVPGRLLQPWWRESVLGCGIMMRFHKFLKLGSRITWAGCVLTASRCPIQLACRTSATHQAAASEPAHGRLTAACRPARLTTQLLLLLLLAARCSHTKQTTRCTPVPQCTLTAQRSPPKSQVCVGCGASPGSPSWCHCSTHHDPTILICASVLRCLSLLVASSYSRRQTASGSITAGAACAAYIECNALTLLAPIEGQLPQFGHQRQKTFQSRANTPARRRAKQTSYCCCVR